MSMLLTSGLSERMIEDLESFLGQPAFDGNIQEGGYFFWAPEINFGALERILEATQEGSDEVLEKKLERRKQKMKTLSLKLQQAKKELSEIVQQLQQKEAKYNRLREETNRLKQQRARILNKAISCLQETAKRL